jgi:hypothetical protein
MFGSDLVFMFVLLGCMALISFAFGLKNWIADSKDLKGGSQE